MTNSYWKTSSDSPKREKVQWPSGGQIIRQAAIAVVVTVAWAGLLVGCVSQAGLGGQGQSAAPASEPEAVAAEVEPADTPTLQPAATATPLSTGTPVVPTETPAPTVTTPAEPEVTTPPDESGALTETPLPEPAPTDTPTPAPTETPPPADTPTPAPEPDTSVPAGEAGVSYANDVFPIIERRCIKCHGGPKDDGTLRIEEGLDLRTYAGLLEGSWNGPVIEPGNAEDSYLVEQIVSGEMPKREPRLLPGEIRVFTEWINAGAPDN
jgi:hypothetical protein